MDWQPISTAPKDGTEIDLWADGKRCPGCAWIDYAEPGEPEDGEWLQKYAEYPSGWFKLHEEPTHWMPLPEPPG